jgi:hypothetical protein
MKSRRRVASYQETKEYNNGLDEKNNPFIFTSSTSGNLPEKRLIREKTVSMGKIT